MTQESVRREGKRNTGSQGPSAVKLQQKKNEAWKRLRRSSQRGRRKARRVGGTEPKGRMDFEKSRVLRVATASEGSSLRFHDKEVPDQHGGTGGKWRQPFANS